MALTQTSFYTYPTPFGVLTLGQKDQAITAVVFGQASLEGTFAPNEVTTMAATEIMEYLAGKRTCFDVPLAPFGSAFQQRAWKAIANIPYGQTRTAHDIAETLQPPTSPGAIGAALRLCPTPILIPLHRVVSSSGKPLSGGEEARRDYALLQLERQS